MKVRFGVMEKEVLSGIATGGQSIKDSMVGITNFKVLWKSRMETYYCKSFHIYIYVVCVYEGSLMKLSSKKGVCPS